MIILGIDPGFERCGAAIVDTAPGIGNETVLHSRSIRTSSKDTFGARLFKISLEIEKIIKKYSPHILAIETLYFSSNHKTAMRVAEARGVVICEASRRNLKVYEFTPSQIKVAVTGHGSSDKKQVENMVRRLVSIPKEKVLDDEIDAIAVALTCSSHNNF